MKKFLLSLLILMFWASPCLAQERPSEELYRDFSNSYKSYQSKTNRYNTAKSRHVSYQSISSRAEFLDAAKSLLFSEAEAILVYGNFVRKRLVEATNVLNYQENLYFIKLDDEITAVGLIKTKLNEVSTLAEISSLWKDLEGHFKKIAAYGALTKSHIEIGSAAKIYENLKVTKEKIGLMIEEKTELTPSLAAAKDKFTVSEKDFSGLLPFINEAKATHKSFSESNDPAGLMAGIRSQLNPIIAKSEKLLTDYRNIVLTLIGK